MLMLQLQPNIFRVISRNTPTFKEGWQTWQKVNINFETFSPAHATVQIDVDGHAPTGDIHWSKILLKMLIIF